jgi:predicted small metal-binding protein
MVVMPCVIGGAWLGLLILKERGRLMVRKVADCREYPSESNCSLTIAGEEEEVVRAASEHAISVHKHEDTPELREQIRAMLRDEAAV